MEKKIRQKRAIHHVDPHEIKEAVGEDNEKTKLFFSIRLNELLKKKETAQEDLASKTGLSMSSISTYRNGKAEPKITAFNEIVNALNVSADYLLGNTTVESTDPKMRVTCAYTGLTDEAVKVIKNLEKDNSTSLSDLLILDTLLKAEVITELVRAFGVFLLLATKYTNDSSSDDPELTSKRNRGIASFNLNLEIANILEKGKDALIREYHSHCLGET